jgi:two-component system phosphate regulon response regulator PhoB
MSDVVLIVEDERDLSATLEYALTRAGFTTRTAGDGRRALDLALAEPVPDLVLLDLELPDVSGLEVCRRLRATERTRAVPIIIVSARTAEVDRAAGFAAGADDYVVKPFSVRELLLRCRAVVRRRRRAARKLPPRALDRDEALLDSLAFRLQAALLGRCRRVHTRDALLAAAWQARRRGAARAVDSHLERLRERPGEIDEYRRTGAGHPTKPKE